MIRGHQLRSTKIKPLPPKMRNGFIRVQQRLRRDAPQAYDSLGTDAGQLPKQKRQTGCNLVLFRSAIFRGPAFHHVRDVHVFAPQAHGGNHLIEQLPGAAHEGLTPHILVMARSLSHKNQFGLRIANTKDDIRPPVMQFAARAACQFAANTFQRIAINAVGGFEKRWPTFD